MSVEADELAAVFEARGTAYVERPQREGRRSKRHTQSLTIRISLGKKRTPSAANLFITTFSNESYERRYSRVFESPHGIGTYMVVTTLGREIGLRKIVNLAYRRRCHGE